MVHDLFNNLYQKSFKEKIHTKNLRIVIEYVFRQLNLGIVVIVQIELFELFELFDVFKLNCAIKEYNPEWL